MTLQAPPEAPRDSKLYENDGRGVVAQPAPAEGCYTTRMHLPFVMGICVFVTILAAIVPLKPLMPTAGLDPSWMLGLNQAVAQRLVFGRDIVMTFGPYASIYTKVFHPATDRLMIVGSLVLALAYSLLLVLLGRNQKPHMALLFALVLAACANSRDALLYSYPLLLGLVIYRVTLPDDAAAKISLPESAVMPLAILFAPLGFLPIIKLSLLPICGAVAIFSAAILWQREKAILACAGASTAIASCILCWALSGQPLPALLWFFPNTSQIISGYTEAMALPGNPWECVLYILTSVLVLFVAVGIARIPRVSAVFLGCVYASFLFLAFKAGFVRHEPWHNITAGSSILIAGFSLFFVADKRHALPLVAVAAIAWGLIGHTSVQEAANDFVLNIAATYDGAFEGIRKRLTAGELNKEYDRQMAAIHSQFPIDRLPGESDIYSYNQSGLLASGNVWSPRPVFQSYSAYTPDLAELNLQHLKREDAADNIFFRVEPIDERLPSLEDGISWEAIINRYSLTKLDGQFAYFRKRAAQPSAPAADREIHSETHKLGEEVPLPETSKPLFAKIDLHLTLPGRALQFAFKPPELLISLRLRDGRVVSYRAISGMMAAGFLITPLVRSTEEFALFAEGGTKYLGGGEVKSFTISSGDNSGRYWNPEYSLSLRKMDFVELASGDNSPLFDKRRDGAPRSFAAPDLLRCDGGIESVNGSPPTSATTVISGALYLNGWMAVSANDGIVPDAVYVTITNETGKTIYVQARRTRHEGIKQHFHHPEMPDPGFAAMVDVSDLQGRHTLGLARAFKGNVSLCQQFKLPLLVNP